MWETNDNLMQILSKNYQFMDRIEEYNSIRKEKNLSYKTVDELYVSPAVKRQIWQTLKVVKELQKVMECAPKRVFVEMARGEQGNQKDKRRDSRKKQLIDLYKKCKEEERDWIEELNKNEDQQLRSDKLYLYYTQKGRCMYSGEIIQLEDLWDNTKYDIDHIYPQSKTIGSSCNQDIILLHNVLHRYNRTIITCFPCDLPISDNVFVSFKHHLQIITSSWIFFYKPSCILCEFCVIRISNHNVKICIFRMMKIIHITCKT